MGYSEGESNQKQKRGNGKKNCKTLAEETCESWKEKCADQT